MNAFPLPHAAFTGVAHPSYTDVAMTNAPPQYPHSPHVAMGLLDPGGGNFIPHYPHQRLSPLPQVEAAYDREERYALSRMEVKRLLYLINRFQNVKIV